MGFCLGPSNLVQPAMRTCAHLRVCEGERAPARPRAQRRAHAQAPWTRLDEVELKVGQGDRMSQSGSLREVMPATAGVVDDLRQALGREWADRLVLGGKQGRGTFWTRETCPDGVVREFGSRRGQRGLQQQRQGAGHGPR